MASKVRIRRKDLRRPDEFVTWTSRALLYVQQRGRLFAWSAAALAVVLVAAIAMLNFRTVQRERASAELAQAAAQLHKGDYDAAVRLLEDFRNRWPGSEVEPLVNLYLGEAHLGQGNPAQAAVVLEDAVAGLGSRYRGPNEQYLQQQALVALGYAREAAEQYDKAAESFSGAAGVIGPYAEFAILGEARNHARAGHTAEALAAYGRYLDVFPGGLERSLVEGQLAALRKG